MRKFKFKNLLFLIILFSILTFDLNIGVQADTASALLNANPVIQVVSYEIIDGSVELDNEFTIEVTLKNCNAYATAYNIIVDSSTLNPDLRLDDGQINQVYFASVAPNSTVSFTQTYSVESTYPYKSAMITYSFNYSGESGKEFDNSSVVTPEVIIPCKLKLNALSVASTTSIGAQTHINVRCTNDGNINMSSLVMLIDGNISESQKIHDFGSLASGEQIMMDCYVSFLKVGTQTLSISFEYKDESGITYTLPASEYSVEVTSGNSLSVDNDNESSNGKFTILGKTYSVKFLIMGILITTILLYVILRLFKQLTKGKKII